MKFTYLLAIVMSVAVLPNISAAQNPESGPGQGGGPVQSNGPTQKSGPAQNNGPAQNSGPAQNNGPAQNSGPAQNNGPAQNSGPAQNNAQPQYQNSSPSPPRPSNAHNRPVYKTGAVVHQPPPNGLPLIYAGISFIFNNGIYYRQYQQGYTVVRPPAGLKIRYMPNGYEIIIINGRQYYFYQGIYYDFDSGYYRVINEPVNNVIYTDSAAPLLIQPIETPQGSASQSGFQLGRSYKSLPQGAQSVTINGQQYFQYADIYFLPQSSDSSVHYIAVQLD